MIYIITQRIDRHICTSRYGTIACVESLVIIDEYCSRYSTIYMVLFSASSVNCGGVYLRFYILIAQCQDALFYMYCKTSR